MDKSGNQSPSDSIIPQDNTKPEGGAAGPVNKSKSDERSAESEEKTTDTPAPANSTTQQLNNLKTGLTETISMRCQPIVKQRFKKLCTFRIQAGSSVNDGDVLSQLMDFAKENSGMFATFTGIKQSYKID